MRDITEKKFRTAASCMGFGDTLVVTDEGLRFVADDGLRVAPVLHEGSLRVDRRASLAHMSQVRKRRPYRPAKSEATGVGAPMASF